VVALIVQQLRRRPGRALLSVFGMFIAVVGLVGLTTLVDGARRAWDGGLGATGADIIVFEYGAIDPFNGSLPRTMGAAIEGVDGVETATPVIMRLSLMQPGDAQIVLLALPDEAEAWQAFEVVSGTLAMPGQTWPAVIGRSLAEASGLQVGDAISVLFQELQIVGLVETGNHLGNHSIHLRMEDAAELLYLEGAASFFSVAVRPDSDSRAVAAEIVEQLPGVTAAPRREIVGNNQIIALLDGLSWSVSLVAMVSGTALVATTMMMNVIERRNELALYKCVGWSNSRVLSLVLGEGAVFGVVAGLLGTASGFFAAWQIGEIDSVRTFLDPGPSVAIGLSGVLISVLTCLLGALLPAWHAMTIQPVAILSRRG